MQMERQPFGGLTPSEIEEIAEKAAERALEKVYVEVGKGVLRKVAWLLGVALIGLLMWLGSTGNIK